MSVIECYVNGVLQTDGVSGYGESSNSIAEEIEEVEVEEEEPAIKSEIHHSSKNPSKHKKDVSFPSISNNIFLDENFENKYTNEKLEMMEKKRKESINPRVQHSNTTEFNSVLSFFRTLERKKKEA